MKFHRLILPALAALGLTLSCTAKTATNLPVIPYPAEVEVKSGTITLPETITFSAAMPDSSLADLMAYLPSYRLPMTPATGDAFVRITVDENSGIPAEGYRLATGSRGVDITASTPAGAFYGLQTLAQMARDSRTLPETVITDSPRFPYRGLHIDVSRHFFDKDYIKKQLDLLATYKINRFHWHLTDGAGWRLEVPGLPRLTDFAAWRTSPELPGWSDNPSRFCDRSTEGAYGGYYTADDVREVVEYARLRHITVIPEIEMPGHSEEVTAAYPELSCDGESHGEVCIGSEETFRFFETVLDEVVRIFPSHYIHIGGDEASSRHWAECPRCRKRMEELGITDPRGLQNYMINRIEKYLNAKGRDIIGWDEILEGGVAPNATVMSWRNAAAGIEAARQRHFAIMTPESHCYFDHPQDDPETQPLAFGPMINIAQVYSFNPVPDSIPAEVSRYILGVQGNTWAEKIFTPEHDEYMIYPRVIALAEVGWTPDDKKNYGDFMHRVNDEIRHIRSIGYNPFTLSEQVHPSQEVDLAAKCIYLTLASEKDPIDIRYTLDGSEPTLSSELYTAPFTVRDSIALAARLFDGDRPLGRTLRLSTDFHKAIGKRVTYAPRGGYYKDPAKAVYQAGGDSALVDGQRGGHTYMDGRWQGFCPNDLDVTIDLGEVMPVHRIHARFMQMRSPQVFLPERVEISVSADGATFTPLHTDLGAGADRDKDVTFHEFGWRGAPTDTRYIRYHAVQGRRQFLFTDEIVVQ